MTPSEKYLLHRLKILDAMPKSTFKPNANRTRFIAELEQKLASGHQSEGERLSEAESAQEVARKEARDQLLGRSPHQAPHPGAGAGLLGMAASAAEQAAGARRVQAEGRAWQVAAMRRDLARQRWAAAAPSGSQVGAHARGLAAIARANNSG